VNMLLLVWGCWGGGGFGGCDDLRESSWREDCRYQAAVALGDDSEAIKEGVASIPEMHSRDLLRLRLAVRDPQKLGWLCEGELETSAVKSRCRSLVNRPHLRVEQEEAP